MRIVRIPSLVPSAFESPVIVPRLLVVLPPLLAWVGVIFEYSNKYKEKKILPQYDTIWYINITNYITPKKERAAYNNEYPVGGAERKDSLAIGRPFVHIRWLVVVDQLGEEQQIDLENVKVIKNQWESESFWHLCLCSKL